MCNFNVIEPKISIEYFLSLNDTLFHLSFHIFYFQILLVALFNIHFFHQTETGTQERFLECVDDEKEREFRCLVQQKER